MSRFLSFFKNKNYYLFFIFLSLLLIILDNYNLLSFLKKPVESFLNPIKKSLHQKKSPKNPFLSDPDFINQFAAKELAVKVLNKKIAELKKENELLKKQINAPLSVNYSYLPANVIGFDRYLIIDKGSLDNVEKNQPVVFEDLLVGKVINVSAKTAKIILPLDPDSKIPALDQITGAKGLVIGQFQTDFTFEKVLTDEKINKGDLILTSGQEKTFPPNLIIAEIEKVKRQESEIFQSAQLKPLIDYQKLSLVFLIKNHD